MRINFVTASIVLFSVALALGAERQGDIAIALMKVHSADPAVVQRSIADLRNAGPDGLNALLDEYDNHPVPNLIPTIDAVASQRGAVVSRLYWYTDLATAEAAAQQQDKPILYLRMMGKLTDEYSCANSRFFRTVLYSNRTVSAMLRERFVLVWQSERPVPVVTIDYGDGRTLKRTLTGNSIHYVLNWHGEVFDALPGLFDPVTFGRIVSEAGDATYGGFRTLPARDRDTYLKFADDGILRQWQQDASTTSPQWILADAQTKQAAAQADAAAAMRRAISKTMVEAPLLRAISPQFAGELDRSIDALDDSAWQRLAALHAADATLDEQSVAVIKSQNPAAYSDPAALEKTVQQFQTTIAQDTVRDNYQMRRQVLAWLRQASGPVRLEDLNRRVYAELFLTPRNDPWLGLMPASTYTALTDDGSCSTGPQ